MSQKDIISIVFLDKLLIINFLKNLNNGNIVLSNNINDLCIHFNMLINNLAGRRRRIKLNFRSKFTRLNSNIIIIKLNGKQKGKN